MRPLRQVAHVEDGTDPRAVALRGKVLTLRPAAAQGGHTRPLRRLPRAGQRVREEGEARMLRIVIDVRGETLDAQGVKEVLAMDLEKHGDVRVVSVEALPDTKQMRLDGT